MEEKKNFLVNAEFHFDLWFVKLNGTMNSDSIPHNLQIFLIAHRCRVRETCSKIESWIELCRFRQEVQEEAQNCIILNPAVLSSALRSFLYCSFDQQCGLTLLTSFPVFICSLTLVLELV